MKLLAQLGLNKILAYYLGPTGFALVGQYQSIMQMLTVFSTNTLNSGIVKKTAEGCNDDYISKELKDVWRGAVIYSILCTVIVVLLAILFGERIAEKYLGNREYSSVPLYFASAFLFFCFNNILISILNGFGKIELIMISNVIGSLISVLLVYFLVINSGVIGAMIALSVYQGIWFFVTLFISRRFFWLKAEFFFGNTSKGATSFLFKFVLMSLTTAVCVPFSQIYIRSFLISEISLESAGYWEAMQRLSLAYLSLITTVLSIYFLPKFSTLNTKAGIKAEMVKGYVLIVPLLLILLTCVYYFKNLIITIVYSKEFLDISGLIFYQLLGDFFKICSWVLSYFLIAKAITQTFVILEVIFTLSYVVFTQFIVQFYGFEYVALGYALNYLVYLIVLVFLFIRKGGYFSNLE